MHSTLQKHDIEKNDFERYSWTFLKKKNTKENRDLYKMVYNYVNTETKKCRSVSRKLKMLSRNSNVRRPASGGWEKGNVSKIWRTIVHDMESKGLITNDLLTLCKNSFEWIKCTSSNRYIQRICRSPAELCNFQSYVAFINEITDYKLLEYFEHCGIEDRPSESSSEYSSFRSSSGSSAGSSSEYSSFRSSAGSSAGSSSEYSSFRSSSGSSAGSSSGSSSEYSSFRSSSGSSSGSSAGSSSEYSSFRSSSSATTQQDGSSDAMVTDNHMPSSNTIAQTAPRVAIKKERYDATNMRMCEDECISPVNAAIMHTNLDRTMSQVNATPSIHHIKHEVSGVDTSTCMNTAEPQPQEQFSNNVESTNQQYPHKLDYAIRKASGGTREQYNIADLVVTVTDEIYNPPYLSSRTDANTENVKRKETIAKKYKTILWKYIEDNNYGQYIEVHSIHFQQLILFIQYSLIPEYLKQNQMSFEGHELRFEKYGKSYLTRLETQEKMIRDLKKIMECYELTVGVTREVKTVTNNHEFIEECLLCLEKYYKAKYNKNYDPTSFIEDRFSKIKRMHEALYPPSSHQFQLTFGAHTTF